MLFFKGAMSMKSNGAESGVGSGPGFRRRATRISIKDRFKKNLGRVIDEANSEPAEELIEDGPMAMEPPPLPRRGKFNKVNRYL